MALLGLVTYFVHGVLNNFLDMDKSGRFGLGFCGPVSLPRS